MPAFPWRRISHNNCIGFADTISLPATKDDTGAFVTSLDWRISRIMLVFLSTQTSAGVNVFSAELLLRDSSDSLCGGLVEPSE
jgi:hypothetical protein